MISQHLSQDLVNAIDRMPAFPRSVQRILEMTADSRCAPKDLVPVIDKDPVLTVKILKVVNSAYFSLPKQVNSIGHAVVLLGFNTTKNLALGIAAMGMLPNDSAAGLDWHEYLLHSLVTAGIAKQLATTVSGVDPMDCFVAGLLHDFGKVVLARSMPAQVNQALKISRDNNSSLHLAMREVMGADHAAIGAMLVEKWRFGPTMVETIRSQFGTETQDTGMVACVFAANQISKKLHLGSAGNPFVHELPPGLSRHLGGSLDEVIVSLGDLTPIFKEAQLFATSEGTT